MKVDPERRGIGAIEHGALFRRVMKEADKP